MAKQIKTNQLPVITDLTDAKVIGLDATGKDAQFPLANIVRSVKGIAFPSTDPPGIRFAGETWLVDTASYGSTFPNFGGITVPVKVGSQFVSNARFVLNNGNWNLQRELVDSPTLPPPRVNWSAIPFKQGADVTYLGKYWKSNAATQATDVPGTSPLWDEEVNAYADKSSLAKLTPTDFDTPPALNVSKLSGVADKPVVSGIGFSEDTFAQKWTFVPISAGNRIDNEGYTQRFQVRCKNAEVGRTAIFYILREITSGSFKCVYASSPVPVELNGLNTYTPISFSVPVLKNDVVGVLVNYVSSANGIVMYTASGTGSSSQSASFSVNGQLTVGTVYAPVPEVSGVQNPVVLQPGTRVFAVSAVTIGATNLMVSRAWGNKPLGYLQLNSEGLIPAGLINLPELKNAATATPPAEADGYAGNINTWSRTKVQNDNFGQMWVFADTSAESIAKYDAIASEMFGYVTGAQTDRTVHLYVIQPLPDGTYKIAYKSPALPAPIAGIVRHIPSTKVLVPKGSYIGQSTHTADLTKATAFYYTGGPTITSGIYINNSSVTEGSSYAGLAQPGSRVFLMGANVYYPEKFTLLNNAWGNMPNGFVRFPSDGLLPSSLNRAADAYWKGKKIIWLGTSIPAGNSAVGGGAGGVSYPMIVGEALGANMVNEAVGSSGIVWDGTRALSLSATIAELNAAFPGNSAQSYETKLIGKSADLVVFDHGFNDRQKLPAQIGTIDSLDRSTFYGAFNYVIDKMYTDNPKIKFVFVSPPNRFVNAGSGTSIALIDMISDALKALALKYNAPFFDMAKVCGFNDRTKDENTEDGTHPRAEKRPVLAQLLYNFIKGIS